MSPDNIARTGRPAIFSDIYTALLALTAAVILGTVIFLVVKCMTEYGTIFKVAKP